MVATAPDAEPKTSLGSWSASVTTGAEELRGGLVAFWTSCIRRLETSEWLDEGGGRAAGSGVGCRSCTRLGHRLLLPRGIKRMGWVPKPWIRRRRRWLQASIGWSRGYRCGGRAVLGGMEVSFCWPRCDLIFVLSFFFFLPAPRSGCCQLKLRYQISGRSGRNRGLEPRKCAEHLSIRHLPPSRTAISENAARPEQSFGRYRFSRPNRDARAFAWS